MFFYISYNIIPLGFLEIPSFQKKKELFSRYIVIFKVITLPVMRDIRNTKVAIHSLDDGLSFG